MAINNFPTALQGIIQQNFLEREFEDGLKSKLAYRKIATRETFPNKIGETITKTRPGWKVPVTTPMNPANNTNLDNGMTPSSWTMEQYTLALNQYGDTIDLNIVNDRVGLASQFLQNAKANGVQAIQSLDRIARGALFNGYLGGNTFVRTTLGAAGPTVAFDDVRGFQQVLVNGTMVSISGSNTLPVMVGSDLYQATGYTIDATNVSTAFGGVSGTVTFSTNVTVADGTAGQPAISSYAPTLLRPNGRSTVGGLVATDILTMGILLDAQAQLRNNGLNDNLTFYGDNKSFRQLFADQDFKLLYQGQYQSETFRDGQVFNLLGIDFVPTTEAPTYRSGSLNIRHPILVADGALVEGDFAGMMANEAGIDPELAHMVDGICQVTREPLDRLQQIIAQSWYWIGGFVAPTDVTANTNIIPTASSAYLKRAVVIQTA